MCVCGKEIPDAYLADDPGSFNSVFFDEGSVDGVAIILPTVCCVGTIARDEAAEAFQGLDEAFSIQVMGGGHIKTVASPLHQS